MKIKIRSLIWKGISLVLIVGLIVAICIGTSTAYFWQMQLDRILCPPITDSEAVALGAKEGQQMAAQVITEGAVLLENKDNVLPLSKDDDRRVNVFGYNSVDWMHGTGSSGSSGRVMKENANSEIIDFLRAMTRYGISYNSELQEIYKSWAAPVRVVENAGAGQLDIKEAPMSIFSDDVLSRAEQYSRTAFVVISRSTAEGVDASTQQPKNGPAQNDDTLRHFLEISAEEEALLTYVGGRYDKTIVLLNAALPMECGFMKTIPGLDALVHVGQTGTQAVSALPALLYGDESFSGRTADTYSYDITEFSAVGAQTDNWLEGRMVTNKSSHNGDAVHTVEYVEGIYVGYKWYETADVEGVWANVDKRLRQRLRRSCAVSVRVRQKLRDVRLDGQSGVSVRRFGNYRGGRNHAHNRRRGSYEHERRLFRQGGRTGIRDRAVLRGRDREITRFARRFRKDAETRAGSERDRDGGNRRRGAALLRLLRRERERARRLGA